jgi:spore coat polysaccharide biosynthesis protein SpsF
MRIEVFVQARMGSTRLPGKVMMPVLGKPLLEYLIERLQQIKEANAFAILTTTQSEDDMIVNFCQKKGVACYRGSEEDVLARYHQVALERHPDAIVRITADCPLIDPEIVDQVIKTYREAFPTYDYVSNGLERTYPRGLDTEVFSFQALDEAFKQAKDLAEREHVTPYIYRHSEKFHLKNVASPVHLDQHRWTVDTFEDFTLIRLILEHLYSSHPSFRLKDILHLIEQHPDWSQINVHIKQKQLPSTSH